LEDLQTSLILTASSGVQPDDLPFLQSPDAAQEIIRPGSDANSFGIHISLPLAQVLELLSEEPKDSRGRLRGYAPLQPSGRLLLYDDIPLGDDHLQVLLTVEPSGDDADQFAIVGELSGDKLPPFVKARLYIGDNVYVAEAHNGVVRFERVTLDAAAERITLTLETPD
jgi:hypothetical protein